MSVRYFTSKDVAECACPSCGAVIEMWKDDVKRKCPRCKTTLFNPKLGNTCLSWCAKAEECLGNLDIEEWKKMHTPEPKARIPRAAETL